VVTRELPDFVLVIGNLARIVDRMSKTGKNWFLIKTDMPSVRDPKKCINKRME
jgi:hypothetical protein